MYSPETLKWWDLEKLSEAEVAQGRSRGGSDQHDDDERSSQKKGNHGR
jgi:hypothetical protein